jgi:hypothetical protein
MLLMGLPKHIYLIVEEFMTLSLCLFPIWYRFGAPRYQYEVVVGATSQWIPFGSCAGLGHLSCRTSGILHLSRPWDEEVSRHKTNTCTREVTFSFELTYISKKKVS